MRTVKAITTRKQKALWYDKSVIYDMISER